MLDVTSEKRLLAMGAQKMGVMPVTIQRFHSATDDDVIATLAYFRFGARLKILVAK